MATHSTVMAATAIRGRTHGYAIAGDRRPWNTGEPDPVLRPVLPGLPRSRHGEVMTPTRRVQWIGERRRGHPLAITLCPPGHPLWHGTPPTSMTHIAIQGAFHGDVVDWLAHATDADHLAGPTQEQ